MIKDSSAKKATRKTPEIAGIQQNFAARCRISRVFLEFRYPTPRFPAFSGPAGPSRGGCSPVHLGVDL
jgi:hypothetical protein